MARSEQTTLRVGIALSLAVHGLVALAMWTVDRFAWPSKPIAIELKLPKPRAAGAAPRPAPPRPPEPPRRPAATVAHGPTRGPRPAPPAKPAPPPPPPTPAASELKGYAPDAANVVVLLRVDKLARSPHRSAIERLLVALPDYRTFIVDAGVRLEDFVAVLVATPDPRDVGSTFLAVRYVESPRVRALANRALGAGDPRVVRFLRPGLAVLARPDDAARLDALAAGHAPPPPDGGADPHQTWLAQLGELEQAAKAAEAPALLATVADLPSLVRFGDALPTPLAGAVALTLDDAPALRVRATFASEEEALKMEAALPDLVRRYRGLTALLGLATALDDLKPTRRGAELEVAGRLPAAQVRLALDLANAWVSAGQVTPPPVALPPDPPAPARPAPTTPAPAAPASTPPAPPPAAPPHTPVAPAAPATAAPSDAADGGVSPPASP